MMQALFTRLRRLIAALRSVWIQTATQWEDLSVWLCFLFSLYLILHRGQARNCSAFCFSLFMYRCLGGLLSKFQHFDTITSEISQLLIQILIPLLYLKQKFININKLNQWIGYVMEPWIKELLNNLGSVRLFLTILIWGFYAIRSNFFSFTFTLKAYLGF